MNEAENSSAINGGGLRRVVSLLPKRDWLVVGWVLAIKVLVFVFAVASYHVLQNQRIESGLGWLKIWNRWDALHFQQLAEFGYSGMRELKSWFYPLFPWSVRLVTLLTKNYIVSAFLVSGIASIVAAVLLRRLVRLDFPAHVAQRAVWFFLIFPTAYFLHIGYTESLFLALAIGSILAARTGRWWLAGSLGALGWMVRAPGIALVPTLGIEAMHQYWCTRRWQWRWLWIALVPLGFVVYLLINLNVTGDAFSFFRMRTELFFISTSWPWVGIRTAIGNLHLAPGEAEMVGAQETFYIALGFIATVVSWIKLRPVYSMWMTANWLLFTCVTYVLSVPRYTLTMFPIFILFSLLAANRFWNAVITVWSLFFFALFASLFAWGRWAF